MNLTSKILQDSPSDVDEFGGKGHERTANALADALHQLRGSDGAIGLEGSWGAGKSTVIKIAEKKLKDLDSKDEQYAIFTFDLWAHQSDDFRRAFLESFVAWLDAHNILTKARLDTARDAIRDRIKEVKVESTKKYNIFGIAFILILPLLPFIYAWLSPTAMKPSLPGASIATPTWLFCFFVTLLLSLYGCVILRVLHLTFDWKRKPPKRTNKSIADALSNAVSMFSKDVESETTTQNIRESDPTTIEFHRIFRELLSEAQSKGRSIVHVLDNIDRLPRDFVPNTWSEVRSLFAIRGGPSKRKNDNVLIVLPYDKHFVLDAFDVEPKDDETDKEADFIEKTFSRTLRVAPPISHDWRNFFFQKLNECFGPTAAPDEDERLFRLLRYSFQKANSHASPRRIIHFVNELGALNSQWGETISLEACAVYILNRKKIESALNSLQEPDLIDNRYLQIAGIDDLHRQLAALTFNVDPESANQVLLHAPISKAIVASDSRELQQLSKIPGFLDVLQDVLQDPSSEWRLTHELFECTCRNLASLDLDEVSAKSSWRDIAKDIYALEDAFDANPQLIEALSLAITGVRSAPAALKLASKLRSAISTQPTQLTTSEEYFNYGKQWFLSTLNIQQALKATASTDAYEHFLDETSLTFGAETILGVAYQANESADYVLCDRLNTTCKPTLIDAAYEALIATNPSSALKILNGIHRYFSTNGLQKSLGAVFKILQTSTLTADEDAKVTRKTLLALSGMLSDRISNIDRLRELATPLVQDGTFFWHGYRAQEAKDLDATAAAISILMALKTGAQAYTVANPHPHFGQVNEQVDWYNNLVTNGTQDSKLVQLIAENSPSYNAFTIWQTRGLTGSTSEKLYQQVLIQIVATLNFKSLNTFETLMDYPKIKALVNNEDGINYLRKLNVWSRYFSNFTSDKKLLSLPSILITDIQIHAIDTDLAQILHAIDKHIENAMQSDWETAFINEDDLLRILIVRHKDAKIMPPLKEYRPALLEHAVSVLNGEVTIDSYQDCWSVVFQGLATNNQSTVANEVLIRMMNIPVTEDGLILFLGCYRELLDRMKFVDHPDTALNQIFSKLVVSADKNAMSFIDSHLDVIEVILASASAEAKGAFEEAIQSLSSNGKGVEFDRTARLKQRFGIVDKEEVEKEKLPETEENALQAGPIPT